jgi:hypothetical protein
MKRTTILALLAVVMVFALVMGGCGKGQDSKPSAPAINMQDGQWEMTTQMNMPGMPANAHPPITATTCISKSDPIPQPKEQQKTDCKITDKSINGNTVTFAMVCPNMTMKSVSTYAGTTFEGTNQMTIKQGGKDMVMNAVVKGKYIGPCPQPPAQK